MATSFEESKSFLKIAKSSLLRDPVGQNKITIIPIIPLSQLSFI